MKKLFMILLAALMTCSLLTPAFAAEEEPINKIVLSSQQADNAYSHRATLNGNAVPEYDYAWHADPSTAHEDVKNSPAEYYTGTKPTGEDAVYIAHDIIYYPELAESKFQKVNYDGEAEWVYLYEAEGYENFIFSTLPVLRTGFPSHMMHSEEEAWQNAVLHITKPGTYELQGQWHGQIKIDLGDEDDVYADPTQKVTLILNGVDITCTVAPGVIFTSVYECDHAWEDADGYNHNVDTSEAGANVILSDGSVNNVTGTNVFRILKTKYKDEDSTDAYPAQKKSWKIDGAFYSYQSMNISGSGTLNIIAGFEGLDSEHHLTLNGGNVHIYSQDDGINVNEDGVSVLTVNDGNLHICAGLGAEGDGIDSNGFLVVNGGTVITMANPASDSGLDSDCGSFVNGGTVVALGSTMDWAESDGAANSTQPVLNLRFANSQIADEAIVITDSNGKVVFAYDPDKDEVAGNNQRTYMGAIVSAPGLHIGSSYQIYIGGDVTGTEVSGVYDASTVTGFTGATLQCYSGNAIGGFGGGGRPDGMTPPSGGERPTPPDGEMQSPPEGMEPGQPPEGMEPGGMPEGSFGGGQKPDGMGGFGGITGPTCNYDSVFTLSKQVNAFSGVADYAHALTKADGQDGYICSGCGKTFADANGTTELSPINPSPEKGNDNTLLICALIFAGVAILTGCVTAIILVRKKKQ